jgi:hypothetical protein
VPEEERGPDDSLDDYISAEGVTGGDSGKVNQIVLRLHHLDDLFVLPQTDMFSEYRNYLTGMEFVLNQLRGSGTRMPIRLVLLLPRDRIHDGDETRVMRAIGRYCDDRISYNRREVSATRRDGASGLWIGAVLTVVGLLGTVYAAHLDDPNEFLKTTLDHLGFVLAWVGLWYPLDTLIFTPRPIEREIRGLRRLKAATVSIRPYESVGTRSGELGSG